MTNSNKDKNFLAWQCGTKKNVDLNFSALLRLIRVGQVKVISTRYSNYMVIVRLLMVKLRGIQIRDWL